MKQKTAQPKKKAAASMTSGSIAEQTEKFLKSGGVVEKIISGRSGQKSVSAK